MKATLRPIEAADNEIVAQIIRQVMTEFQCTGKGYSIEDPEVNDMHGAYQGDSARFYVIEYDGQVVGCGGFAQLAGGDNTICELKKMYFLPVLRGKGMGKVLLQHCIEAAKVAGYTTMYLETVDRMIAANAMYQKYGFTPLSGNQGATGHSGCDAFYSLSLK